MASPARSTTSTAGSASPTTARELLMVSLSRFYAEPERMRRVLPFITCTSGVSLRLVDWFVTNYSKKHNVILTRAPPHPHINVYMNYRAQLKAYSKQQFDPFRRRDRVLFYYEPDAAVETTIGQLNFFRWMLQNDILDYVVAHAADIERDMLLAHRDETKPSAEEKANQMTDADTHQNTPQETKPTKQTKNADHRPEHAGTLDSPDKRGQSHDAVPDEPGSSGASDQGSIARKKRGELSAPSKAVKTMMRVEGTHRVLFE